MCFSWEFQMRNIQKSRIIRYKTRENDVIWAFLDDFRHNAFLPRISKWEYTRNHSFYAIKHTEMWFWGQLWTIFDIVRFCWKITKWKCAENINCVLKYGQKPSITTQKSILLAFCIYFMKTWFVISRKLLTILDFFCNRAQVRFRRAPCDFSKTPEM